MNLPPVVLEMVIAPKGLGTIQAAICVGRDVDGAEVTEKITLSPEQGPGRASLPLALLWFECG
jgi:hypothetical protein